MSDVAITGKRADSRARRFAAALGGSAALRPLGKLVLLMAIIASIIGQAVRPVSWRRPVRAEFWRFMDIVGAQGLVTTTVLGVVLGVSLLAQGLYWYGQFGDRAQFVSVIGTIIVREIAPILVGLLAIGRGGLTMLSELGALRQSGHDRALDAMGLDPFLLFVMPRAVALALSVFCLSIVLIYVTFLSGYAFANLTSTATLNFFDFLTRVYTIVGSAGYAILPIKTVLIGLSIGAVCAMTVNEGQVARTRFHEIFPVGFVRCVLVVIGVSTIISMLL